MFDGKHQQRPPERCVKTFIAGDGISLTPFRLR